MAPAVSALSPLDPDAIPDAERQSPWILRKMVSSMPGRIVMSTFESLRTTGTTIACLSPWGDSSIVILPCVRIRDLAVEAVVISTGGVAHIATPVLHFVGDSVISAVGDSIVVDVGVYAGYEIGSRAVDQALAEKLFGLIPKTSERLKTTAAKSILITLRYKHTITDAALGFYRSSMHPDSTLMSNVADYVSIQKGWFSPYLHATNRRPIIPRAMRPDVVFCHGPFVAGDYRVAETLLAQSASVITLCAAPPSTEASPKPGFMSFLKPSSPKGSPSTSRTPSAAPPELPPPVVLPPRRLLVCLLGIKPFRGLWAQSARPEESIFHYILLNGCPCIVLPAQQGCPLIAWDTLTLADMYKKVAGGIDSSKWQGIVKILAEYVFLCVDWDRVVVPMPEGTNVEPDLPMKEKAVTEAIDLLVEGAVRSVEYKELKKNMDIDRAGVVMFRMP